MLRRVSSSLVNKGKNIVERSRQTAKNFGNLSKTALKSNLQKFATNIKNVPSRFYTKMKNKALEGIEKANPYLDPRESNIFIGKLCIDIVTKLPSFRLDQILASNSLIISKISRLTNITITATALANINFTANVLKILHSCESLYKEYNKYFNPMDSDITLEEIEEESESLIETLYMTIIKQNYSENDIMKLMFQIIDSFIIFILNLLHLN